MKEQWICIINSLNKASEVNFMIDVDIVNFTVFSWIYKVNFSIKQKRKLTLTISFINF